jgi:hypothetical protein
LADLAHWTRDHILDEELAAHQLPLQEAGLAGLFDHRQGLSIDGATSSVPTHWSLNLSLELDQEGLSAVDVVA